MSGAALRERFPVVDVDLLPEGSPSRVYQDGGCELAPSCLACPFEVCRYDRPYAPPPDVRAIERKVVARGMAAEGMNPKEIAAALEIHVRSVYRYLGVKRIRRTKK